MLEAAEAGGRRYDDDEEEIAERGFEDSMEREVHEQYHEKTKLLAVL